jgi:hypothetical protein
MLFQKKIIDYFVRQSGSLHRSKVNSQSHQEVEEVNYSLS